MKIELNDLQVNSKVSLDDLKMGVRSVGGTGGITEEQLNEALDTKVDKTTEALKIYGTDSQGNQVEWAFRNTNNTKNTVAGRDSSGNIQVGTAANSTDAVNKEYAEGNFVAKNTTVTGNRVYTSQSSSDGTIKQGTVGYATGEQGGTLALRDTSGRLYGVCTANSGAATLTTKQYVDDLGKSLAGQNEYIGSYDGTDYTSETIQTILSDFVQTSEGREKRNGDLVNIVNAGIDVDYSGQQWIYSQDADLWKYYIDFENHSVIDNLESDSAIDGLSANQGKILNETKLDKQSPEFDSGATRGYVYFIDPNGNQIVKKVQIQANNDTIPLRNPSGTFYVGNATLPYEAVNKGYVDGAFVPLKTKSLNNGVHAVYGVDGNTGEQMLFEIDSTGKKYYHLVRQKENGRILVGDAVEDTDAVNLQTLRKSYATDSIAGVARWVNGFGLGVDEYGRGKILQASNDEITAKTHEYKPITPKNLDFAIVQALTNNSITLTDEQKTAIKNWLGL